SAVRLLHVWVEAYLPYGSYRGAAAGNEGRQWVSIEPAIPGAAKYAAQPAALDALAGMGTTAAALTDAFLASPPGHSPLQFVRGQLQSFLTSQHPELSYSDVQRSVVQRAETLSFLPGTLPYKVVSVVDEPAFLPDEFKHRMRFVATDPGGVLF